MSIRDNLLGSPKKPLRKVEINGESYFLRHPTIGAQDAARVAGGVSSGRDGKAEIANMPKFQASLLINMLVDEGNNPVFTAADMGALCEADVGGDIAKLMGECSKFVGEANDAGKNSTEPTEGA